MSEQQARELFKLFNTDFNKGKRVYYRLTPAFVGQTANGLVENLDAFNQWTARLWRGTEEEATAAVGELLSDRKLLPSAGTSYPTMLRYLRSSRDRGPMAQHHRSWPPAADELHADEESE